MTSPNEVSLKLTRGDDRSRRRSAFTLIELSVVLVLVVLSFSIAVVKMREPYQAARFKAVSEQIIHFDHLARSHAKRSKTDGEITIDIQNGQLNYSTPRLDGNRRIQLDNIAQMNLFSDAPDDDRPMISVSGRGRTPTYAIELIGSQGQKDWLLFAGRTGQVVRFDNQEKFQELCDSLFDQ